MGNNLGLDIVGPVGHRIDSPGRSDVVTKEGGTTSDFSMTND